MVYICYAPNDKSVAEKVYMGLKQKGLKCWISSKDVEDGQVYAEAIIHAIENSSIIILIYSSNANISPQIINELEKATSLNKFIVPFKIELSKPSKLIEYYLSSPYKLDATNGVLEDNINTLETTIRNIYDLFPKNVDEEASTNIIEKPVLKENAGSNIIEKPVLKEDADSNIIKEPVLKENAGSNIIEKPVLKENAGSNIIKEPVLNNVPNNQNQEKQNAPSQSKIEPVKKSKSKGLLKKSVLTGAIILSIIFILIIGTLFLSDLSEQYDPNNDVPSGTSTSTNSKDVPSGTSASKKTKNFTEEDIIDFAKTAILELSRLGSTSEFYDSYGYRGPEYDDIYHIQEDVFFSIMGLDVVDFEEISVIGKNVKPHGIEHLLQLDFICYADYMTKEDNEPVHLQGEALLHNNVVILETPNEGLKYLYMEGITDDALNARNEDLESSYLEMAESDNINTEDTIQTYFPDSPNENAIMSVKDIVRNNDHKVVSVFVETKEGVSQGSGFFIKDGVIVTNYHVVEGGLSAEVFLTDETFVDIEGVLFSDSHVDIAVLKLANEIGVEPVSLGQANDIEKGAIAVAIGSPLGLFNTVSTGIISNLWDADGVELIQISIPITHGNSGGALFSDSGKLIGITTSGVGEANLNFAISSSHINPIYDKIKNLSFNQLNATSFSNMNGSISISYQNNSSNQPIDKPNTSINSSNQELLSSKYKFANSNTPIPNELIHISDLQTIYSLFMSENYTNNFLDSDLSYAFNLITDFVSDSYKESLKSILHETCIKEDIEAYTVINSAVLEIINDTGQYVYHEADSIEVIGAGIKKDGSIDGIVVRATFLKNDEPYVRSKFYFRPQYFSWGDRVVDKFLYVGELMDR